MTTPRRYPDIEKIVGALLVTRFPALATVGAVFHVANHWPADLGQRLPFCAAYKVDGRSDTTTTLAMIDIDFFARTRDAAELLAAEAEQFFLDGHHRNAYGQIDSAEVFNSPKRVPWEDSSITRYHASYWLSARR